MISVKNLSKKYGSISALENINLSIKKNEFLGILGPNGAGKTTLINILTTYLEADKGEVTVNGFSIPKENYKLKKIIGIVPQEISLYEDLTAEENLRFWGKIYKMPKDILDERITNLLKKIGLNDRKHSPVKKFSSGMKRRLNIAAGIIHNPDIIFFDEPTVGVDPQSRNYIHNLIKEMHIKGKTVIYTSHYMEEIERLCSQIVIIDHGKIIAEGNLEEILSLTNKKRHVFVKFKNKEDHLTNLKLPFNYKIFEDELSFQINDLQKDFSDKMKYIKESDFEYSDIKIINPNLEQVFLDLTGRELRE